MEITQLGASIRQARLAAGLTQAELAERIGTTQSVVARWERGKAEPRLSTVLKVGGATGAWVDLRFEPRVDPHDWLLVEGNLRLSVDQRIEKNIRAVDFARVVRGAGIEALGA